MLNWVSHNDVKSYNFTTGSFFLLKSQYVWPSLVAFLFKNDKIFMATWDTDSALNLAFGLRFGISSVLKNS